MPRDRFGCEVSLAYAPHELEYLKAADTLRGIERENAYFDISLMLGRTISALKERARKLRVEARSEAKIYLGAAMGRNWLPEVRIEPARRERPVSGVLVAPARKPAVDHSQAIRPLTEFEKQTGRRARPLEAAE